MAKSTPLVPESEQKLEINKLENMNIKLKFMGNSTKKMFQDLNRLTSQNESFRISDTSKRLTGRIRPVNKASSQRLIKFEEQ